MKIFFINNLKKTSKIVSVKSLELNVFNIKKINKEIFKSKKTEILDLILYHNRV